MSRTGFQVSTVLIAIGLAAGGHFAYWLYVTSTMKQQLAVYAQNLQKDNVTFDYTARAAGYPLRTQLALENVKVTASKQSSQQTVMSTVEIPHGLTLETVNPFGQGLISTQGRNIPVAVTVADAKGVKLALKGEIASLEATSAFAAANGQPGPSSMVMQDFALGNEGFRSNIGRVESQSVMTSLNGRKVGMEASNITMGTNKAMMKIEKLGMNGDVTLPDAAANAQKIVTPFNMHFYIGKVSFKDASKNQEGTIEHSEFVTKLDVRDVFSDLLLMVGVKGVNMPATTGADGRPGVPIVVKTFQCSLGYANLRNTMILNQADTKQRTPEATKELVDALVKDKLSIGIRDCSVDAQGLNATLAMSLGGTDDGYPDIAIDLKGHGEALVPLNMLKGMFLPQVSGTVPEDPASVDMSLMTVSGTLVMNGQKVIDLPKLQDLLMMAPAMMQGGAVAPTQIEPQAGPVEAVKPKVGVPVVTTSGSFGKVN